MREYKQGKNQEVKEYLRKFTFLVEHSGLRYMTAKDLLIGNINDDE